MDRSLLALAILSLVAVIVTAEYDDIDEEGILHVNEAMGLRPGGQLWPVKSAKYPERSPSNLLQTWRVVTSPGHAIRLHCYEIRLPYRIPGQCTEEYVFKVEDGDDVKEYCGGVYDLHLLSKTSSLSMSMRVGDAGYGFVNCTAQGREIGPHGEVTEAPTTAVPPPTRPPYTQIETEEIDSSEHGVAPGRKNTNCNCGWTNKVNSRIVGGREARVHEYPHMVAMVTQWQPNSVFCGGSLITQYHVLTAAHCTYRYKDAGVPMAVRIGDHDYTTDSETNMTEVVNVVEIIEHEQFNRALPLIYDLSLLVLEKRIEFSKLIGPVCLPTGRLNLDNKNAKILGWGLTSHRGQMSNVLKSVHVRIVPEEQCFSGQKTPDSSRLCTFAKKRGSCNGDSGGPVMWLDPETNRYTLVGLVSYGSICGGPLPIVNADVTGFVDWVHKHVRATRPEAIICSKN